MSPTNLTHVRLAWALFFTFLCLVNIAHGSEPSFITTTSTSSIGLDHGSPTNSTSNNINGSTSTLTDASSPTSTGVPRQARTWQELNQTCELLLTSDLERDNKTLWEIVDGEIALERFEDFYRNNRIISSACPECFEQRKEDCESDNPECDGLRDDIHDEYSDEVRWDTALGLYLGLRNDLNCDSGGQKCPVPNCEETEFRSPGDYLLLKGTAQLSAFMNDIWEGVGLARDSTSDSSEQLKKLFLPVKSSAANDMGFAIAMAVISAILTICFAGLGAATAASAAAATAIGAQALKTAQTASQVVTLAGGITDGLWSVVRAGAVTHYAEATKKEDIDAQGPLGRMADNLQRSLGMTTTGLFSSGQISGLNVAALVLTSLFAGWSDSSVLIGENMRLKYMDIYTRSMIHQYAVQIWEVDMGTDQTHKQPVIYFAEGECANAGRNIPPEAYWMGDGDITEHRIDYDGKCWWLIGAATTDGFQEAFCDQARPLPGAAHAQLQKFPLVVPTTLLDLIVPSIETWKTNKHTNLFQDGLWMSKFNTSLDSHWSPGLGSIPICDYFGSPSYPGRGCPAFGQKGFTSWTNDDNKLLNYCNVYADPESDSNDRYVTPGFFIPGECDIQVWHFRGFSHQGDFMGEDTNAYEMDQYGVSIKDAMDAEIGTSGTAAIGNKTLRVWNSALPEEIWMHVSPGDSGLMQFWYGSQFWTSEDGNCKTFTEMETFAGREVRCSFRCDKSRVHGVDATIEHPLPTLPDGTEQPVFSGVPLNVIMNTATANRPVPTPENRVAPSYKPGKCHVHVTFWDREEFIAQPNELDEVMLHARLKDENGEWIGAEHNALQVARWKAPVPIYGLKGNLTMEILWDDDDDSPLGFVYKHGDNIDRWATDGPEGQYGTCTDNDQGDYRTIHCDFECE